MKIVLFFSIFNYKLIISQTNQKHMKKFYDHLEELHECEIKKCFGKGDFKNEIKIEERDDINDQAYSDCVSQFIFRLFDF